MGEEPELGHLAAISCNSSKIVADKKEKIRCQISDILKNNGVTLEGKLPFTLKIAKRILNQAITDIINFEELKLDAEPYFAILRDQNCQVKGQEMLPNKLAQSTTNLEVNPLRCKSGVLQNEIEQVSEDFEGFCRIFKNEFDTLKNEVLNLKLPTRIGYIKDESSENLK